MAEHTGPYDVEIWFGVQWELLAQTDTYLDAKRWQRVSAAWRTRVIDRPSGRIISTRHPQ